MGIFSKKKKKDYLSITDSYKLLGNWDNIFSSNNINAYEFGTVRTCIHTLAENTAKLNCEIFRDTPEGMKHDAYNNRLQKLIETKPNPYMNGKDFLYKVRTLYEIDNNAYIYIDKNVYGDVIALYPIPFNQTELIEYNGQLYFKFYLAQGYNEFIAHFDDIAVLRQYYSKDLFFGDSSTNILKQPIDTLDATNQAIANASKSSGQIRGILKATNGMIDPTDVKKMRDRFVESYANTDNTSGIAGIDSSLEFKQLNSENTIINVAQRKELRDDIYRNFGVNDEIIMSKFDESSWSSFYSNKIEPFALALSLELTNKIFTEREKGYGNIITFSSSRLEYANLETKLGFKELVDRGTITPNEHRGMLGLKPYIGGDDFVIRKEYTHTANLDEVQGVAPPTQPQEANVKGGEK